MDDAEVAATLLNNRTQTGDPVEPVFAVAILREGGLEFDLFHGLCKRVSDELNDGIEVECIVFSDGSCALRLGGSGSQSEPTQWMALSPSRQLPDIWATGETRRD